MVRAQKQLIPILLFTFFGSLFTGTALAQDDPPTRVLRLSYINGNVSAQPAGVDDWGPAPINRPFSIGDYLYTDQSSVAELVTDVARIRMGQYTNFGVLNLTDTVLQLRLTEGDMYFRVHDVGPDQVIEVDTPNASVSILRAGTYRIHVDPNQNTSFVAVRGGQAEITGGGQAFTLNPGNSATLAGTDQLSYDIESVPAPDQFDDWCARRDQRFERAAPRYIPPSMVGYEDLQDNGDWNDAPEYGHVWYPRTVAVGWAPYHNGHWAWVEPWGWTWVDDAPWGFAPFHYGRWVYYHERWGWTPGPYEGGGGGYRDGGGYGGPVVRPCYAPALVAWFGGAHFGVSISIGGGAPNVGWVPLGYGEVYTPSYHVTPNYFRTVNVSNTRITNTTNITNVYNNVYVNKTVYNTTYVNTRAPNAVVAMPQNSFASGRPVAQHAIVLQQQQIAQMRQPQVAMIAPPVAPTRQATMASLGTATVRPPAQLMQQRVVARTAPPPPPPSFQARQTYLQQHVGQPVNTAQMQRAVAPPQAQAQMQRAVVVVHPPVAKPQVVQVGARVGNVPKAAVNNRVSANAGQAPPSQPQSFNRPGMGQPNAAAAKQTVPAVQKPAAQNQISRPGQPPVNAAAQQPVNPAMRPRVVPVAPNQTAAQPTAARPVAPQNHVAQPPPANVAPNAHGLPPNQRQNVPAANPPAHPAATAPQERVAPVTPNHTPPVPVRPVEPVAPRTAAPTEVPAAHNPPKVEHGTPPAHTAPPVERPAPPAVERPARPAVERPAPPAVEHPAHGTPPNQERKPPPKDTKPDHK